MKRIFFIVSMFLFMNITYAEECTEQKLQELKQIAESIVVDTEFDPQNVNYEIYDRNYITIQGLQEGFYIISGNRSKLYEYSDNVDGKIEDVITPEENKLYIFNNICPNEILKEIKLSLKTYNEFSEYEECKGISGEELDVCDKYYSKSITYEEFVRKVNKYKSKQENNIFPDKKSNIYIYSIILGITLLIGIIAFFVIRRKRNILD